MGRRGFSGDVVLGLTAVELFRRVEISASMLLGACNELIEDF